MTRCSEAAPAEALDHRCATDRSFQGHVPAAFLTQRSRAHVAAGKMKELRRNCAWQGFKRGHWSEVRYRGDPLARPIASYEVAPLARVAVRASRALNSRLQLDVPVAGDEPSPAGWLQVD